MAGFGRISGRSSRRRAGGRKGRSRPLCTSWRMMLQMRSPTRSAATSIGLRWYPLGSPFIVCSVLGRVINSDVSRTLRNLVRLLAAQAAASECPRQGAFFRLREELAPILFMTFMNYEITFDDLVAAYLHVELRGDPVVCTLPIECQTPEERRMVDPCRRLLKAPYGLTRAGHDFSAWAEGLFDGMKWTNARSFDVEPSAYVRNLDGSRVLASNPPLKR